MKKFYAMLIALGLMIASPASGADEAFKGIFGAGKGFEIIDIGPGDEKCEESSPGIEHAPCVNSVSNTPAPLPMKKSAR